ncbi:MAG: hypothetical protein IPJ34_41725 [Myxococcales bacterium]|nr:hypothetical protein [Myxococcales bacterium]
MSSRPVPEAAEDMDEEPELERATVFVTDPTVESARVESALRGRGYDVIEVPLAMLVGRVTVQCPHVILLDVDAEGALEVAGRVRAVSGADGVHLVYLGEPGRTFESAKDAFDNEGSGFFARPIDVEALVRKLDALLLEAHSVRTEAHAARLVGPNTVGPRTRVSSAPPRPSRHGDADLGPPSLRPSIASEPPPSNGPSSPGRGWPSRAEARLSPDLERLLREAESRVLPPMSQRPLESSPRSEDEILSPEDEVEAVLPAEILASLDEPLDADDDEHQGSSETGGTGNHGTSGTPRGSTGGGSTGGGSTGGGSTGGGSTGGGSTGDASARSATNRGTTGVGTHAGKQPDAQSGRGTTGGTGSLDADLSERAIDRAAQTNVGRPSHEAAGAVDADAGRPPHQRSTPRPPRRELGREPTGLSEADERSQSQVSPFMGLPAPAPEHAPPLAPQTARPPAPRTREPDPPTFAPVSAPAAPVYSPARASPLPPPPAPVELPPPRALTSADDALRALAHAVAARLSGVLRYDEANGIRRIVLQDGDVVTAASSIEGESLVGFLVARGDLAKEVAQRLGGRIPPFGRLAGAALVAHGHLHQDQLWDVLQAHATFLLVQAVSTNRGRIAFEAEPPARLRTEPPVFGGTPGPALLVEIVRRSLSPSDATARLGGPDVRFAIGPRRGLLDECGLDEDDDILRAADGGSLRDLTRERGEDAPALLYALVALGVLEALAGIRPHVVVGPVTREPDEPADPVRDAEMDDAAVRARIGARRALVEDGDYFAILGVSRAATGYELKRAYLDLRKALDPQRVLRPSLADLVDDLTLVLSVIDEAYDVLKDATRRERYRRAIG